MDKKSMAFFAVLILFSGLIGNALVLYSKRVSAEIACNENPRGCIVVVPKLLVYKDLIKIQSLTAGSTVSSPLTISGMARGNWFFEGSFPVILTDWDGKIIAEAPAQAQGEWMTTQYVPFTVTLHFNKPDYGIMGALIFKKDNPSGLVKYDDAFEISIAFKQ